MQNVDEVIDCARRNPKVDELYRKVNEATPIVLEKRSDGYWSHRLADGRSTIGVSPTQHPQESLFHELLHADLKNNGHISYLGIAGVEQKMEELSELVGPIDEELQHHRMFGRFVDAGFAPERFYCDADTQTYAALRQQLTSMPASLPAALMLPQFLSIIAPGGAMSDSERQELLDLMRSKSPSAFGQLEDVRAIVKNWAVGTEADPGLTVVGLLRVLNRYDCTWICPAKGKFPDGGHFIGQHFKVEATSTSSDLTS